MLFDATHLRTFVAICETLSFTKAGHLVNLTQSAVSGHVKRLEEQIGCRLLDRDAHRLKPTGDGEVLLFYARRILALHAEAESQLSRKQPKGLLRLGAPEYFSPQTLASLLEQFTQRYPSVKLEVELGIGPDIEAQFTKGCFDLAIVNHEIGDGDGAVIWRERRVWAAMPGTVIDLQAPIPLAVFPPHCGWRRLAIEMLEQAGLQWMIVLQSAGVAGIVGAVEAGLALSIFAESDLSHKLTTLGPHDGLPTLPAFEYVLRRKPRAGLAADRLAEVIIDFFQLSAALREKRGTRQDRPVARPS